MDSGRWKVNEGGRKTNANPILKFLLLAPTRYQNLLLKAMNLCALQKLTTGTWRAPEKTPSLSLYMEPPTYLLTSGAKHHGPM